MKPRKAIVIPLKTYPQLVKAIEGELLKARRKIDETQKETNWNIGGFIKQHLLLNKERAGYGNHLFKRLALGFNIDRTTLYQTVQFYETYPIVRVRGQLTWSHYRALITIQDPQERQRWEKQAVSEDLSADVLEEKIRASRTAARVIDIKPEPFKLPVSRGRLFHYQLCTIKKVKFPRERVLVDVGFRMRRPVVLKEKLKINKNGIYELITDADGYRLKSSDATAKEIFTFKAIVQNIIDGDTPHVDIDCGLDAWVNQRLRLKGLDCPELNTPAGRRARRFVVNAFNGCPFIIVKTYKSDKYDRFLTDVFYLPGATDPHLVAREGRFLNQELIDAGLAKIWEK